MEKEIEWSYRRKATDGTMIIGHSKLDETKQYDPKVSEVRELSESGVAGYLDQGQAVKFAEPPEEKSVVFSTLLRGDDEMSEKNDYKYQELKEDLRDSERRITDDIKERERRFEESLKTFHQDSKEREERFMALAENIRKDNSELKDDIKDQISSMKEEISATRQDISNLTKHNESLATTNKWSNIATITGISAIVVAVIIALISFLVAL